jgi:hypothetical protein
MKILSCLRVRDFSNKFLDLLMRNRFYDSLKFMTFDDRFLYFMTFYNFYDKWET